MNKKELEEISRELLDSQYGHCRKKHLGFLGSYRDPDRFMQIVLKSHPRLILFCCELLATKINTGEHTYVSTFFLGEKNLFGRWRTLYGSNENFMEFDGFRRMGRRHIIPPKNLEEARFYHTAEYLSFYSLPEFNLLRSEYLLDL